MQDHYTVRHLSLDEVERAYPLVQSAAGGLSLENWETYAAGRLASGVVAPRAHSGIVAVENAEGYLQGLFGYRVDTDLRCGLTLQCENLIALAMIKSDPVIAALVEAMESLARMRGCQALHVTIQQPGAGTTGHGPKVLKGAGLSAETVGFCKRLEPDSG